MIKKIDSNSKIFSSSDFIKDKTKFYLILKNLKSPTVELYSDEENYVICIGPIDKPIWIWTVDNLNKNIVHEITAIMEKCLTINEKTIFTCKKEFYELLAECNYTHLNDRFIEMGTLCCKQTTKPKETDGYIDIPNDNDKRVLAKYWFDDNIEMRSTDSITMEEALEDINKMCEEKTLYIWRNNNGKVVCMVNYSIIDDLVKLSHVYTPKEERNKGYAANLIYEVTNKMLTNNLIALLYTDYNYVPSNKAYMNAGYEDTGTLINFSRSK